jgi:hypothetical protein
MRWPRLACGAPLAHTGAQGAERCGGLAHANHGVADQIFQVFDRRVDRFEVVLVQTGKQHHVADAAGPAIGGAAPSEFGSDGNRKK